MKIKYNNLYTNKLIGGGKTQSSSPIIFAVSLVGYIRISLCIGMFLCIGLFCVLGLASCQSEELPLSDEMQALYAESQTLSEVGEDSCTTYIQKFINKVNEKPSLMKSEYYQPTFRNIYQARSLYNINISLSMAGWNEPVFIDFEFGK